MTSREDTTLYIERSKVREILIWHNKATQAALRKVDRLPIFTAADIAGIAQAPMDREKVAKIFAYIWHGDLGEWQGFLSKADAFLTYPVPSTSLGSAAK